ncbi:MAG: TraI domain-containing protein, partial [Saprospiraceae bacterium]
VMWADQESVRRDLVNQRLDVDEYAYGVPVERFIFDALRRLVNTSKINQPGSLIWRLEQGVFIAWTQIVPKVHQLIEEDKIPGVPRSADTLADILIERGFAIPYQESTEVKPYRYWRIYPEAIQGVALLCLRIDDLELIFTNEPPAPAKASFNGPKKQRDENPEAEDAALIDAEEDDDELEKKSSIDREKEFYTWDEVETASNEKEVNDKSNHNANCQFSLKSNLISKVTEFSSEEEEKSENKKGINKINIEPNYNSNL